MLRTSCALLAAATMLAAAGPAAAQSRQPSQRSLCAGDQVATQTNYGRIPLQKINGFEVTPELIQGAALHASVAEAQQTAVERALMDRMSGQGKWGRVEDRIWPQVRDGMMAARPQADAVAQQKREMAGRVIAGTVAGIGSMAMTGRIDSGMYAAQNYGGRGAELAQSPGLRMPSGGTAIATGPALERAVDQMVAMPCEVSAGQVLQQLGRR